MISPSSVKAQTSNFWKFQCSYSNILVEDNWTRERKMKASSTIMHRFSTWPPMLCDSKLAISKFGNVTKGYVGWDTAVQWKNAQIIKSGFLFWIYIHFYAFKKVCFACISQYTSCTRTIEYINDLYIRMYVTSCTHFFFFLLVELNNKEICRNCYSREMF